MRKTEPKTKQKLAPGTDSLPRTSLSTGFLRRYVSQTARLPDAMFQRLRHRLREGEEREEREEREKREKRDKRQKRQKRDKRERERRIKRKEREERREKEERERREERE